MSSRRASPWLRQRTCNAVTLFTGGCGCTRRGLETGEDRDPAQRRTKTRQGVPWLAIVVATTSFHREEPQERFRGDAEAKERALGRLAASVSGCCQRG